ncbi:hypothetical protein CVT24_011228 [Panaeolus cyanescens]|uniref:Uncharacterized protein n=1 Tax=Panaeolus cyanescens TaxID=181874 RepID=A0A409YGF0_9AGAR|nr:hypothetical protein CVT24_011228 [Panaeolus cyanescens]
MADERNQRATGESLVSSLSNGPSQGQDDNEVYEEIWSPELHTAQDEFAQRLIEANKNAQSELTKILKQMRADKKRRLLGAIAVRILTSLAGQEKLGVPLTPPMGASQLPQ